MFLIMKPTHHKLKLRKESGPLYPLPHHNRSASVPRVGLSFHICKNGAHPCVSPQGWGDLRECGCSKTVHSLPLPSILLVVLDRPSKPILLAPHITSLPPSPRALTATPQRPPLWTPPAPSPSPGPVSNLDFNLEQLQKPHLLREACLDGSFPTQIKQELQEASP